MAFVDEVRVHVQAGAGGPGVIRWLHTKEKERGGPAGGDGGRGGDVIIEGIRDLAALATYRYTKKFRAENGTAGANDNKHGKDGAPVVLKVPVGTLVRDVSGGKTYEVMKEGEQVVVFSGGAGGYGNAHFKGSTNQNPFTQTNGKPGEGGDIELTLKLIADVGFVGFPNAGKSSLLNALTRAKSKVGAYAFTTLEPNLGDFYGHILADIPGLIEGASTGKGLGSKFLRHIERTGFLLHLVSAEQDDVVGAYRAIRSELEAFGRGLSEKPEILALSKIDVLSEEEVSERVNALKEASGAGEVYTVTIADDAVVKAFSDTLAGLLQKNLLG
jgi:GTPase